MHAVDRGQRSYWSGPPVGATKVAQCVSGSSLAGPGHSEN